MNRLLCMAALLLLMTTPCTRAAEPVVVAYVTSWTEVMPDPSHMTHINYAFGHVNASFDGVRIDNPERLHAISALKGAAPQLKVMLSVGGWGSGGFSEMASDAKRRRSFALSCRKATDDYGLDGIDIDWEYPTSQAAGISASEADTQNFTLLMRDLRKALGRGKLLTLATVASGEYIDLEAITPYIDFVNIMAYDMGNPPHAHNALFPSEHMGWMSTSGAVEAHLRAGVPKEKLVVGMPFYGRGKHGAMKDPTARHKWDAKGCIPYACLRDTLQISYENRRSIGRKCQYVKEQGLRGAMYWDYSLDGPSHKLARQVRDLILGGKDFDERTRRVIVLSENAGQHKPFDDAALCWLVERSDIYNMQLQVVTDASMLADAEVLESTDLVIQLDFPPYTWSREAMAAFERYMAQGRGAWIGFHHASLLGDFDGWPMWQWFSRFMGGITFAGYIAPLADGTVAVEDATHPVMADVSPRFVLPDDEWYIYDRSPRGAVHVLASVDERSYVPPSDVRMGDHPVVWTNPTFPSKNVYFQFGHSPRLFESIDFQRMLAGALEWTLY